MNLILESPAPVPYFTDVGLTLRSAGIDVRSFDWYVSDVETNMPTELSGEDGCWLTGEALDRVLGAEKLQFVRGVFSAVPRGARPPVASVPVADGNRALWEADDIKPQLSGALFEIVCWDSSSTILIGLSQDQARAFRAAFPPARDLSEAR